MLFFMLFYSVRALNQVGVSSDHFALNASIPVWACRQCCYLLCNILVVSSLRMTIERKAFQGSIIIMRFIRCCSVLHSAQYSKQYTKNGLTTVVGRLFFSLTGTLCIPITPDNPLQQFHAHLTMLSTSAPHPPFIVVLSPNT